MLTFRWWLFKGLSWLGWWICPEPHRTNLNIMWWAKADDLKQAVNDLNDCEKSKEEIILLRAALREILIGARNQGPHTGMCWREAAQICVKALGEEASLDD